MSETINPMYAAQYLARYGYLGDVQMADARAPMLTDGKALMQFQSFAGLPVTGLLDEATASKMQQPRCGCPDVGKLSSPDAALAAKWRKNGLKYKIASYVSTLDKPTQEAEVAKALGFWSEVANITFIKTNGDDYDLLIGVGRGAADNFDGPSGTLAWAYLPNGNDRPLIMKFDADEQWTVNGQGIRFVNVACHEFGHMLGLEHSRVQSALMAPFYSPNIAKPQASDDIPRIQALYGPPVVKPDPKPDPKPDDPKSPCTICDMVRGLLKQFNTIRHARKWTMAGIEFDEVDRQNLNKILEAATNPTCTKITELLAKIAGVCPAPAPALFPRRERPEPAIGGGLCAGLTGILQILPLLQEIMAMCKPK